MSSVLESLSAHRYWHHGLVQPPSSTTQHDLGALATIADLLRDDPVVRSVAFGGEEVVAIPSIARGVAIAAAARHRHSTGTLVVITPTSTEAEQLAHQLEVYGAGKVGWYPAWETLPFERVSPNIETMGRREQVRVALATPDSLDVLVLGVRALTQRVGADPPPLLIIERGVTMDREALLTDLSHYGYRREHQVESRGEYAVRGSIVDVFPATAVHPVRIDFFGDDIERLTEFGVAEQRSVRDIDQVAIPPARELLLTEEVRERAAALLHEAPWGAATWERIAAGTSFDGMESWLPWLSAERSILDVLPATARVVLVDPKQLRDRAADLMAEESSLAAALAPTWGLEEVEDLPRLTLDINQVLADQLHRSVTVLSVPDRESTPHIAAVKFDPIVGNTDALTARLRAYVNEGIRTVLTGTGQATVDRYADLLTGEGLTMLRANAPLQEVGAGTLVGVATSLDAGVVLPGYEVAVIAESDLSGRRTRRRRTPHGARQRAGSFEGLSPGDYVVHVVHGVGRYEGMVTRAIGGAERDYLLVAYRGADRLYIPSDQVHTLRKYTGGDTPSLHRMGGADFAKARGKARKAVAEIAAELVELYRDRAMTQGHAFAPDTPWQHEMEAAFPYEETPDQLVAIEAVKADMELPQPMDRLICGDVGFGKTEVAIRAAFKAVQEGKQVAVLVPTTLLAQQHGQTFRERFSQYPIRVEVLSRFLSTKETKEVVTALEAGQVDVIIGTHRLLSQDIAIPKLGLLVIDEEQRFGVNHKERIKALRSNVDVLTLTATPIPRTLEMSLTGIRELSLINTPPEDRQPILTFVGEYSEEVISEAIRRELLREGQVFFVHDRVADIEQVAESIRSLVPSARVLVAHGQMDEASLERTVLAFSRHEADVLVCTTIVESGIDMPTVNTLVVDRADRLGLGQLYQLRGRVGRRGQRAYAYLLHPADRALTEQAYERLKTIGEFTDLGSGFKIAMRDLEIRGAGHLLGQVQSGHIAAVGFDLYCEMVTEAVAELTGRAEAPAPEVVIEVPVLALLPSEYMAEEDARLEAYRRLGNVRDLATVQDIENEWRDRYGEPPPAAMALLEIARLRARAVELGITEIVVAKQFARIRPLELKASERVRLARVIPGAAAKEGGEVVIPFQGDTSAAIATLRSALEGVIGNPIPEK